MRRIHCIRNVKEAETGFTLLEMVVAVSVLAVMMAVVAPHVFGIGQRVQATAREQNERTIEAALNEYYMIYHHYPSGDSEAQLQALKDAELLASIPQDPAGGEYEITEDADGGVHVSYSGGAAGDDSGSSSQ
jgi:prepilin-type N-terminal cleavage/methylation domain-containing protein